MFPSFLSVLFKSQKKFNSANVNYKSNIGIQFNFKNNQIFEFNFHSYNYVHYRGLQTVEEGDKNRVFKVKNFSIFETNQSKRFEVLLEKFYRHKDLIGIHNCITVMKKLSLTPSIIFIEKYIALLGKRGNTKELLSLISEVYDENFSKSNNKLHKSIEVGILNALMNCALMNEDFVQAKEYYTKLRKSPNFTPDLITFSTIISVYAKEGDADSIFELIEEMKHLNIEPNDVIYSHLISAYKEQGDVGTMKRILKELNSRRVNTQTSYAIYIKYLLDQITREPEINKTLMTDLEKALHDIELLKYKLPLPYQTRIIRLYIMSENFETAWARTFKLLEKDKQVPTDILTDIIVGFGVRENFQKSFEVFVHIGRAKRNFSIYKSILSVAIFSQRTEKGIPILKELSEKKNVPVYLVPILLKLCILEVKKEEETLVQIEEMLKYLVTILSSIANELAKANISFNFETKTTIKQLLDALEKKKISVPHIFLSIYQQHSEQPHKK